MRRIKIAILALLMFVMAGGAALTPGRVYAENAFNQEACDMIDDDDDDAEAQRAALGCEEKRTAGGVAIGIIDVVIGLSAVIAVGMLIYGGAKYVISAGRPDKMAQAKNIIAYSIVGLVVVLLAFAIVNFVVGEIS